MVKPVTVPMENVNDDYVVLVELFVKDGQKIKAGDNIAAIETMKAVFTITAETDGWIRNIRFNEGDKVDVGEVLCHLSDTLDEKIEAEKKSAPNSGVAPPQNITKKAYDLITKHNLDVSLFASPSSIVSEKDVLAYLGAHKTKLAPDPVIGVNPSKQKIILYGGGGRARVLIDLLRQVQGYEIAGIVDDNLPVGYVENGVTVIGSSEMLGDIRASGTLFAANAVGSVERLKTRASTYQKLKTTGFIMPNLIHPRAMVEPSVVMGEGNQIFAGGVVGSSVVMGDNNTINCGAIVSHDSRLADNVHLAPGAVLAGGVKIGSDTLIGMNSSVYLKVKVGSGVTIKNGTQVFHNLDDNTVV